jgi:hypothetical protein
MTKREKLILQKMIDEGKGFKDIAEITGMSVEAIGMMIARDNPKGKNIDKLANALGVEPEALREVAG